MDWTKAKTILIVALLLTDCVLGGIFYFQYTGRDVSPKAEIEDTVAILADHQIFVNTEIPEKAPRMPVLFVKYEETDVKKVSSVLSQLKRSDQFQMTEKNLKELCDQALKLCDFTEGTLTYDSARIDSDGVDVIYKNIYNGMPLEESGIICRVENGKVVSIGRLWLTPTGYGKTKRKVVQASDALIQFMSDWVKAKEKDEHGSIPDEIHIKKIDLVYWLDTSMGPSDGVEDTALPAWRFTYNSGLSTYINAFDQQ